VFAHPRSRPSAPAAQQLKFCNLALSLLDQSSFRATESTLSLESLIPTKPEAGSIGSDGATADSSKPVDDPPASPDLPRKRKYALMQKLPSGEWWTSLDSDITSLDGSDLLKLPTAHAELVAILPSMSTASGTSVPTLGSLSRKLHTKKLTLPGPRHLSSGSFLDYGPNSSFAPSFEQDGVEVGQFALGEVMWSRLRRVELASKARALEKQLPSATNEDVLMTDDSSDDVRSQEGTGETDQDGEQQIALDPLLEPEQEAPIQDFMSTLDFEVAIQELLDRNKRALSRLQELQLQRLGGENGGASQVEVGSEEWDVGEQLDMHLSLPNCILRITVP
jgi:hypothetical protein